MNVIFHHTVLEFLHELDVKEAADIIRLVEILKERGHTLSMPLSKPVGSGLHELRTHGRPTFRILYGFCKGEAVLVLALKKQKPSLHPRDVRLALERLNRHCAI